jgi:serine/threonine protein kinase
LLTCRLSRPLRMLTGYTGSLRYMAPEVALREPYNEKVDVYSFGIMLWQMARDCLPFSGLGKTAFMQEVVRGGLRPKLDRSWPDAFCSLLTSCWAREPQRRPCFAEVIAELGSLMDAAGAQRVGSPVLNGVSLIKGIAKDKSKTGWF